jgi:hypothetical protein
MSPAVQEFFNLVRPYAVALLRIAGPLALQALIDELQKLKDELATVPS